ncbi:MAG TPA: hypothetical protein C5S51_12535 [Methanosarcinaceae archaeon]|nr:hypothetical protein [Methanosarcinaceae archaeon]
MKIDQFIHLIAIFAVFAIFTTSLSACVNVASAQIEEEDIEWLDAEEYTLYWGDQINSSGYFIKSFEYSTPRYSDVPDDYVMLSILMANTSKSWITILSVNNSNIPINDTFDDKLKVEVVDIVTGINIPSPYSKIKLYLAKELSPEEYLKRTWINTTISMEKPADYEIYIDERAYVEIVVENLKDIHFDNLTLNVTIPNNFVLDPDEDIGWTFDLNNKSGSSKTFGYSIRSTKAGNFTIPATELMLTHLGITYYKHTDSSQLIVHGPTINITKSAVPLNTLLNDVVNITVDVGNEGDRAAHVYITDEIPAGAVLLSGKTGDDIVLQPSSNHTIKYTMRMDRIGDIVIPSAKAVFLDAKGYGGTVESKKMIISVIEELVAVEEPIPVEVEPEPLQEDVETSQPEEPVVETEQSLVDKFKSLPSKAMELPGFGALGLVFAILSAGAVADARAGITKVSIDKRKK